MNHVLAALNVGKRHVAKAHGAHKHSRRISWRGLTIGVENDVGTTRTGVDPDGKSWATTMRAPYGEILGTLGVDGDPLDVFVNEAGLDQATHAFVIHTANPRTGRYDEDKVMLGFESDADATQCFAQHYDEPTRHFGALTRVPVAAFLRRCADKAQQGRSFTNDTEGRVALGQRRLARASAEREDRAEWMRALVRKAQSYHVAKGLDFNELAEAREETHARLMDMDREDWPEEYDALTWRRTALDYAMAALIPVSKAATPEDDRDLYVRVWPGCNVRDLQGELIPVDQIYRSWDYYVACGNVDLEHISKSGGKTWKQKADAMEAAGFDPEHRFARIQYEIGRPVAGTLRAEAWDAQGRVTDFSYVARIHGGDNEAARWFRRTLPHIPWKPSVGGMMGDPVKVVVEVNDPRLGLNRREQLRVARDFRWNNVAMSLETANHWVRPIEILGPKEVAEIEERARAALVKTTE